MEAGCRPWVFFPFVAIGVHSWLEYPSMITHYLKTMIEYAMGDAETRAAIEPRISKLLSQNC
jgi:hypothetical protein